MLYHYEKGGYTVKNSTRYRIIEVTELLAGSVLPIIFWVSLVFGFDAPYVAVLTLVSAIAHELGHSVAIRALSGKENRIRGHSSGLRIRRTESLAYEREIGILMAGPLVNLALCAALLPFGAPGGYIKTFALINLATGVSNLMPIEGYDGYGAICELMRALGKEERVKALEMLSFILSTAVTFLSLYLIGRFGEGYWIFGLFFFAMLSKLVTFGKYDVFGG